MGSSRIISVSSQKGGTGKTTTAINLGAWLAFMNHSVLLIDMDPQADLTMGLGLCADEDYEMLPRYENLPKWIKSPAVAPKPKSEPARPTIYEVLLNPHGGIDRAVVPTRVPLLSCVPSSIDFAGAEVELAGAPDKTWRLHQALRACETKYDFIIIDTPPSLGLFTQNAFLSCTEIVVPLQVHYFALRAMRQLTLAVDLFVKHNPKLHISGIVCTMHDRRNMLSRVIEETVREQFPKLVFETVIPVNVALAEAPARGQPVSLYSPLSAGAQAYDRLAKEVLSRG